MCLYPCISFPSLDGGADGFGIECPSCKAMGDERSVDFIHGILQADGSPVCNEVLLSLLVDENGGTCFP